MRDIVRNKVYKNFNYNLNVNLVDKRCDGQILHYIVEFGDSDI